MTADANTIFARTLVDEWVRCGVRHAVVAPGSRSTPIALALAQREELTMHVVVDERSASFRALGIGKVTGTPAVLLCTSGTAAAHFAPAIIEADAAHVPMLVCTADRPPELHGVGAAQTIDQHYLYGSTVRWFVDPGVPELTDDANACWRTLASRTFDGARGDAVRAPGPVHLNLPFREPLTPGGEVAELPGRPGGVPWVTTIGTEPGVRPVAVQAVLDAVHAHPHGLIVAGWGSRVQPVTMRRFARAAGWPVIADPISNLRTGDHALGAYEALLRTPAFANTHRPSIALRLGGPVTSKITNQWLDASIPQVLIDPFDVWHDQQRAAMTRVLAAGEAVLAAAADVLEAAAPGAADERTQWMQQWHEADAAARTAIDKLLDTWDTPFDGRIARDVLAALPDGARLFVASSMPVRDLESFAEERTGVVIDASRGTNGIDGFASTAIGIALGSGDPVVGLCGDLAFLHDANGMLGTDRIAGLNVTLVVVDNNGGGIFSFLPQAGFSEHFEQLWGTPHDRDLGTIARAYGAHVTEVSDASAVAAAVQAGLREEGLHVVLIRTDRDDNVARHREIWETAARSLNGGR